MKSIMQDKKECYECRRLFGISKQSNLQLHHIFPGHGFRSLSDKYGLTVYLCFYHHQGRGGVHNDASFMRRLGSAAQKAFEKHYPHLNFLEIFGRKYY